MLCQSENPGLICNNSCLDSFSNTWRPSQEANVPAIRLPQPQTLQYWFQILRMSLHILGMSLHILMMSLYILGIPLHILGMSLHILGMSVHMAGCFFWQFIGSVFFNAFSTDTQSQHRYKKKSYKVICFKAVFCRFNPWYVGIVKLCSLSLCHDAACHYTKIRNSAVGNVVSLKAWSTEAPSEMRHRADWWDKTMLPFGFELVKGHSQPRESNYKHTHDNINGFDADGT